MLLFRVRALLGAVMDGLWLHPTLGVALGAGLAPLAPRIGSALPAAAVERLHPVNGSLQPGLQTLAGVAITLLALTLSVLMVVLQSVASQYSPRLVRSILRDQVSQGTFATLAAAVGFSGVGLALLEGGATPEVGAALAMQAAALAALAFGALVYFIHYYTFTLQAPNLAYRVHHATSRALASAERIERRLGLARAPGTHGAWPADPGHAVHAGDVDYVQAFDEGALLRYASRHDLRLAVRAAPGDFVAERAALLEVWPAERVTPARRRTLRRAFYLANDRRVEGDPLKGLELLAEIALRALSPDHNDPRTAETCVLYQGDLLVRMARAPDCADALQDAAGEVRVLRRARPFAELLERALADVARHAAARHPPLLCAILELCRDLRRAAATPERREAVASFAREVAELEVRWPLLPSDRRRLGACRADTAQEPARSEPGSAAGGARPVVPSFRFSPGAP
ncbi:MAG: DUF2254 domain-containing protein [Planctomycetes bacterium]|nr:DUF2254 domain-containing protein [Planctomycetota bacterium]